MGSVQIGHSVSIVRRRMWRVEQRGKIGTTGVMLKCGRDGCTTVDDVPPSEDAEGVPNVEPRTVGLDLVLLEIELVVERVGVDPGVRMVSCLLEIVLELASDDVEGVRNAMARTVGPDIVLLEAELMRERVGVDPGVGIVPLLLEKDPKDETDDGLVARLLVMLESEGGGLWKVSSLLGARCTDCSVRVKLLFVWNLPCSVRMTRLQAVTSPCAWP